MILKERSLSGLKVNRAFLKSKKKLLLVGLLVFLVLGSFLLAWKVYSYFSSVGGIESNRIRMTTLDLEVTDENGSAALPLDMQDVYPGWNYDLKGQVKNAAATDLIFRVQTENGNVDFGTISKTIFYNLVVRNKAGVEVYSKSGYLAGLNEDNQLMNLVIEPGEFFDYCLSLEVPTDMDDFTTPENEDDNEYQGMSSEFDLVVQSTQANNTSWKGFQNVGPALF